MSNRLDQEREKALQPKRMKSCKDTPRQKEILCELVDICDDPEGIYLDWDGKYVSKEEAKAYIMEDK